MEVTIVQEDLFLCTIGKFMNKRSNDKIAHNWKSERLELETLIEKYINQKNNRVPNTYRSRSRFYYIKFRHYSTCRSCYVMLLDVSLAIQDARQATIEL